MSQVVARLSACVSAKSRLFEHKHSW